MHNMTGANVFQQWYGGYTQGLALESGVLNNQPLVDFVSSILEKFPDGL
jgi:hypothetical protein